ncbi:MarR family winged helix-turn-helix transcriptional regulator [Actinomadura opuntiae]|uniref:MarR family winged helix-turn-helix transcriptional regulator n=1 Tax=Actinomadura sp. OS1-43 TaxID=604315 RepID=UPI00255ADAD8|nr:MarR family transcriptional regulator [Actinomadura sp. OS1-43]MDL4815877.1 MarR family transcriptional regulator [Actinomadura sp. OS1-43]
MASDRPEVPKEAVMEIRRGVMRLARRMRSSRSPDALSSNKLVVLGHLARNGPSTAGEVAAAEGQRPQSLTRVFAELEESGLIVRTRDERDRRQAVLTITRAGGEALGRDLAERDAWLAGALAELGETEREVLRLAARVMDRLAE